MVGCSSVVRAPVCGTGDGSSILINPTLSERYNKDMEKCKIDELRDFTTERLR